jgi:hypothetical protein
MRRLASAAAVLLAMLAATPADAGEYRRQGPGWGHAPAWHHRPPPPPRHWYRPYHPAPSWHGWRQERPRHHWRERRYAWGPRDRW